MSPSSVNKISLLLYLLASTFTGYAGDTTSALYPRVVLIQLPSEQNRILAMAKAKKYKEADEVRMDAMNVQQHMKHDFVTNFNYCPVYYYIDTNEELVKNKSFSGILLNDDGSPVSSPIINSSSTDYVVVYYGYALSQSRTSAVVTDSSKYFYDPDLPPGKGLIVLNDKFQQISYIFKLGYGDLTVKEKNEGNDFYMSKHYDIEYFPLAKLFNKKLNGKRGKHNRIKSARYHD